MIERRPLVLWASCLSATMSLSTACPASESAVASDAPSDSLPDAPDAPDTPLTPAWPVDGITALTATPELVIAGGLPAESAIDATDRPRLGLDGTWRLRFDDQDVGTTQEWFLPDADRSSWHSVPVPGAWDLHAPDGYDRQAVGWYARTFDLAVGCALHPHRSLLRRLRRRVGISNPHRE